jgi:hypothetical protein
MKNSKRKWPRPLVFAQARRASSNVDRYTMLTIMLASVLFFAGLATHFTLNQARFGVLLLGFLLFLATIAMLIKMPVS